MHDFPIQFYHQPSPPYLEMCSIRRNNSLVQPLIADSLIAFLGFRRHNFEFDSSVRRGIYS